MTDQPNHDRFALPGDIPDMAFWGPHDTLADARRKQAEALREDAARGYTPSHPAGRGWVPQSRKLGLPDERRTAFPIYSHDGVEHEFPGGTPTDLVAEMGCGQVFTRERRVRFLDHLSFQGNARAAARFVRVSHETAYRARRQDPAFAALWDAAMVHARAYGEQTLASRALEGVEVAIVHHGEITGYVTKHDARLLLAHLGRLDRRVEQDTAATALAERFDELLAGYAGHAAPEGFAEAAAEALDWRERDGAPALPPTRAAYVAWARGQALDALGHGKSEKTEAARMDAAGKAAGKAWDAWHEGVPAAVARALESEGEGGREGEGEGEGEGGDQARQAPLPPAGNRRCSGGTAAGGGPVSRSIAAPDPETPRNSAAGNRVTSVNPPASPRRAGLLAEGSRLPACGPRLAERGGNRSVTPR